MSAGTPDILARIVAVKHEEIAQAKRRRDGASLRRDALDMTASRRRSAPDGLDWRRAWRSISWRGCRMMRICMSG